MLLSQEAKWPTYAGYFAEYLNGKNFLAGEEPTYADFIMWHVVDVAKTVIPGTLDDKKALKEFHERVASLPGVKDYLANRRAV
jgi:glutathione S-transferase